MNPRKLADYQVRKIFLDGRRVKVIAGDYGCSISLVYGIKSGARHFAVTRELREIPGSGLEVDVVRALTGAKAETKEQVLALARWVIGLVLEDVRRRL